MLHPGDFAARDALRRRIIVPPDVSTTAEAPGLVERLRGRGGLFKVGLQFFASAGPAVVRRLTSDGHGVLLDLKLHDIPETAARAVSEVARLGAAMIEVHAAAGAAMIRAALAAGADDLVIGRPLLEAADPAAALDSRLEESAG